MFIKIPTNEGMKIMKVYAVHQNLTENLFCYLIKGNSDYFERLGFRYTHIAGYHLGTSSSQPWTYGYTDPSFNPEEHDHNLEKMSPKDILYRWTDSHTSHSDQYEVVEPTNDLLSDLLPHIDHYCGYEAY